MKPPINLELKVKRQQRNIILRTYLDRIAENSHNLLKLVPRQNFAIHCNVRQSGMFLWKQSCLHTFIETFTQQHCGGTRQVAANGGRRLVTSCQRGILARKLVENVDLHQAGHAECFQSRRKKGRGGNRVVHLSESSSPAGGTSAMW